MHTIEHRLSGDNLKKAALQDIVAGVLFDSVSDVVFHGGTCVWRCYNGRRFSKDMDVYIRNKSSIRKVLNRLIQEGLKVRLESERKMLFYTVSNSADISLQIKVAKASGVVVPYELIDGTKMSSYALSASDIVLEKIAAYTDRRLERDIYDIMVLLNSVPDKDMVRKELGRFAGGIAAPRDSGALKGLIYEGIVPTFPQMVRFMRDWCSA